MASCGEEGSNEDNVSAHHGETTEEKIETALDTPPADSSNTETVVVQETDKAKPPKLKVYHLWPSTSPPTYFDGYCRSLPPEPGSLATNQFVAKQMAKMNYKNGTGLGKYGQGIIEPISPRITFGRGGIGTFRSFSLYDSDSDFEEDTVPPQPKHEPEQDAVDIEEIRAMDTLHRERAEYAAARAREQRHVKKRAANMCGRRLSKHHVEDKKITSAKTEIFSALGVIRRKSESGTLTIGGLIHEFAFLKEKYPEEYRTYRMPYHAIYYAAPLLRSMAYWSEYVHGEPPPMLRRALAIIEALKDMLEVDASAAYPCLINNVVMEPPIEAWEWSADKPEQMLRFVNRWKHVLPKSTMDFIVKDIILTELVGTEDEYWERSRVPNTWVGVWIPHLGHAHLRGVYNAIARWLGSYTPQESGLDSYDYRLWLSWKEVFDPVSWDESIEQYVVSRPRRNLDEFKISSTSTWAVSNCFPLVMRWASLIPVKYMVPLLLESNFFSKWRYATYGFFMGVMLRPEQVTSWYESWKVLFTPELLADERPEQMLRFVNRWKHVLPKSTMDSIVKDIILTELAQRMSTRKGQECRIPGWAYGFLT
uniref:G-patch domain-containing protein n=1 Tax=Leersia perrieri TaxID=77586 RepID=A0A0D9W741_9ORYZ